MIPYFRSQYPRPEFLDVYLKRIQETGRLTNFGPLSIEIEQRLEKLASRKAFSVPSGTAGLQIALLAIAQVAGPSAVALPSFNFSSAIQVVYAAGLRPIYIDIEYDFTVDLTNLEFILNNNEDCNILLIPNLYGWAGNPSDIEAFLEGFLQRTGRKVWCVFDSAHCYGARFDGRPIGSFGDVEVLSFSATKSIGGAEGGAILVGDANLAKAITAARNYGMDDYVVVGGGMNGKLSEPNAAFILAQMDRQEEIIRNRQAAALKYLDRIVDIIGISAPELSPRWRSNWKDMTILLSQEDGRRRSLLRSHMSSEGIDTRTYFSPPLHSKGIYACEVSHLPKTIDISARVLCLPFFDGITDEEITRVVDALRSGLQRLRVTGGLESS